MDKKSKSLNTLEKTKKREAYMKKKVYMGHHVTDLANQNLETTLALIPSKARRKIRRLIKSYQEKNIMAADEIALLQKCEESFKNPEKNKGVQINTKCRSMIVLPMMVGMVIGVYNGMSYIPVKVSELMIGKPLANYSLTHKSVKHGKPGIGATSSSKKPMKFNTSIPSARRKTRKEHFTAPSHIRSKKMVSRLDSELSAKYGGLRRFTIHVNDQVRVLRGEHMGKVVTIDRVQSRCYRIYSNELENPVNSQGEKVYRRGLDASKVEIVKFHIPKNTKRQQLIEKKMKQWQETLKELEEKRQRNTVAIEREELPDPEDV